MKVKGKTINELILNEKICYKKIITNEDVLVFAGVTGDLNPIHLDEKYAQESIFGKKICHGMLIAGYISNVIGTQLPGPGTIYLSQNIKFKKPIYLNDTVSVEIVVKNIDYKKNTVTLQTNVKNQEDLLVIEGEALVKAPR